MNRGWKTIDNASRFCVSRPSTGSRNSLRSHSPYFVIAILAPALADDGSIRHESSTSLTKAISGLIDFKAEKRSVRFCRSSQGK